MKNVSSDALKLLDFNNITILSDIFNGFLSGFHGIAPDLFLNLTF